MIALANQFALAFTAPTSMIRVAATGLCKAPFDCVHIDTVPTPVAKSGEALVQVAATSVNPSDVDGVELGSCGKGCGADVSGTVVECPGCTRLKVGDEVWGLGRPAFAEYVALSEKTTGLKPPSMAFEDAGTIPEVGLTSFLSLKRTTHAPGTDLPAGTPWDPSKFGNLTVLVTSGAGGTGSAGIQLAKAWGAQHIATAASGDAFAFVESLGATYVTDYKKQDIFDTLADNSVDIVCTLSADRIPCLHCACARLNVPRFLRPQTITTVPRAPRTRRCASSGPAARICCCRTPRAT
jgi:NADPH:quinone reductase-like Zn-dependent oxidoreductase